MTTYLYAVTFEPGLVKVGRSRTPHARLRSIKCQPGAYPSAAKLATGKLLSVTRETAKLTEPQVHARLKAHLYDRCREWFKDSDGLRAELASMGFSESIEQDPPTSMVRVGCLIPEELHTRLKLHCIDKDINMGDWIRTAIHRTLAKAEVSK